MPYDYRREGFNCGVCKAQGKEQINLMRPQFSNSRYNRETGQFLHFKDEDVTVTEWAAFGPFNPQGQSQA